jgi:hypothetical protein
MNFHEPWYVAQIMVLEATSHLRYGHHAAILHERNLYYFHIFHHTQVQHSILSGAVVAPTSLVRTVTMLILLMSDN